MTTKLRNKIELHNRMQRLGFSYDETEALLRIEKALQRWAERECGDGSDWIIERDETTGKPFNVYHGAGESSQYAIADKEAGALKRLAKIMEKHPELVAYHQGDCRGCMLYLVNRKELGKRQIEGCYTIGTAVSA